MARYRVLAATAGERVRIGAGAVLGAQLIEAVLELQEQYLRHLDSTPLTAAEVIAERHPPHDPLSAPVTVAASA